MSTTKTNRPSLFSLQRLLPILAASLVLLGTALPSWAQGRHDPSEWSRNNPRVLAAFRPVVALARASTVSVRCDGKEVALGTVVEANGWILTKASELKGKPVCKLKDGRELPAKVVGVLLSWDLAMLKIEARGLQPVEWRESKQVPVGNWLASVGLGEDPVAIGVVSVAARKSSAPAGPGGRPGAARGYLGVTLDTTDEGLIITEVKSGTPAEKAGLRKDDLVLTLAGQATRDLDAFINLVQRHEPGEVVTLHIRRGEEEMDVKAKLAERPALPSRGEQQNRMGSDLSTRRTGFPVFLQHDTVLKPRDCGGPVVDLDGKVIGLNIARAGRTETYALPSEAVRPLLVELKSGKLAPKE